jgi:hypothetical protein
MYYMYYECVVVEAGYLRYLSKQLSELTNLYADVHTIMTLASKILEIEKAVSTRRGSQAVPEPCTNRALQRLTPEIERDPVYSW